jgi:hypothetical protein
MIDEAPIVFLDEDDEDALELTSVDSGVVVLTYANCGAAMDERNANRSAVRLI